LFNCNDIGLEITRNESIANAAPDLVQKNKNKLAAEGAKIKPVRSLWGGWGVGI
jgi:hypothetical protein